MKITEDKRGMVSVAIVEDEEREARKLTKYIEKYAADSGEDIETAIFSNGVDFLEKQARTTYDIVLLDIEMPYMDGMKVARKLREQDAGAVLMFVTNMVQYAVEGYEVDAMAFIVKPVAYNAFAFKFGKAMASCKRLARGESITLTSGNSVKRLFIGEIMYLESIKHSITYHTENGDYTVWNRAMSEVEKELQQYGFARCNSGYLVSLRHVDAVNAEGVSIGGRLLPMSRGRRKSFLEALATYEGGG